jgi:hypothetical protein
LDPAKVSARPADSTPAPAGNKTSWALLLLFTQNIYTEMGQRSHLFVLAALPFIIVRMRHARLT